MFFGLSTRNARKQSTSRLSPSVFEKNWTNAYALSFKLQQHLRASRIEILNHIRVILLDDQLYFLGHARSFILV